VLQQRLDSEVETDQKLWTAVEMSPSRLAFENADTVGLFCEPLRDVRNPGMGQRGQGRCIPGLALTFEYPHW
jgi:hypothetical protein